MSEMLKVTKVQCVTCPFSKTGWTYLEEFLSNRALNEATPICHSTGPGALVPKKKRTSRQPLACRGARLLQAQMFCALGFLDEPTIESWEKKAKELGL